MIQFIDGDPVGHIHSTIMVVREPDIPNTCTQVERKKEKKKE